MDGEPASDLTVNITETTFKGKTMVLLTINERSMMIDPECKPIKVITVGGSGGSGYYPVSSNDFGKGGDGGDGGFIEVKGMWKKYKNLIQFEAKGGKGGRGHLDSVSDAYGNDGDNGEVLFR